MFTTIEIAEVTGGKLLGGSVTVGVVDVGGSRAFLRGTLRTDGAQVLFKLGASILGGVG